MPPLEQLISQYGLTVVLIGLFLYRDGWPFLQRLLPEQIAAARAERNAERAEQREYSDKLLEVVRENTRSSAALQTTLEGIARQLGEQTVAIHRLNEDVSAIYGLMGHARPSRTQGVERPEVVS
jgi:hypothetical protein